LRLYRRSGVLKYAAWGAAVATVPFWIMLPFGLYLHWDQVEAGGIWPWLILLEILTFLAIPGAGFGLTLYLGRRNR
jgi:hypothetical protein